MSRQKLQNSDSRLEDTIQKGWPQPGASNELLDRQRCLILGYPDDEGIANNKGRLGAKQGPQAIRERLQRMTAPFSFPRELSSQKLFFDAGDLDTQSMDLFTRHETAKDKVYQALEESLRVLSLGGGHDYGYADGAAFAQHCLAQGQRPLILNFDAHLDVRPSENGINSGTPFYRILKEFKEIDLIQVGIQEQCNSAHHWQWALDHGVKILPLVDLQERGANGLIEGLQECLQPLLSQAAGQRRPLCYLSVDIDAFSSSVAPGASASWPTGFEPNQFILTLRWLFKHFDVRLMGIYEVCPRLDIDSRTAKLAALLAFEFLFAPFRADYGPQ